MAGVEIDSFVKKFKSLFSAGHYATLNLDSKLGEVEINLSCKVGRSTPPPSCTPFTTFGFGPKYRSHSYYRRQERRKADRNFQHDTVVDASSPIVEDKTVIEKDIIEAETVSDDSSISEKKNVEEQVGDICEDVAEEIDVDQDELARDKIINEILVYYVGGATPADEKEVVEQEIVEKLSEIGISVESMKTFSTFNGKYDQSRVKTSRVNLKDIWGRRLGLKNCAVIEYRHPPSRK